MTDISHAAQPRRRFRAAESEPEALSVPISTEAESSPWLPIDDLARSGVAVLVRGANGETAEAWFKHTRYYDALKIRWVPSTKWAVRNSSGSYVPFEPVEYILIA